MSQAPGTAAYPSRAPMRNAEIADAFDELASLYELDGAVGLPRAWPTATPPRRSARRAARWPSWPGTGRVEELAGVGKTIAEKIDALLEAGSIPSADKLQAQDPGRPRGDHPHPRPRPQARARSCTSTSASTSLDDLRAAAEAGRLADVPGFGAKAEENVIAALAADAAGERRARFLLSQALAVGEGIVDGLRAPRHDGSSWRAAPAGWPTRARTSTSWRPPRTRRRSSRRFEELAEIDVVHSSGRRRRAGRDPLGHPRGPARRARGGVRQPAPALHRLGQAQRGAAHGGGAGAGCT